MLPCASSPISYHLLIVQCSMRDLRILRHMAKNTLAVSRMRLFLSAKFAHRGSKGGCTIRIHTHHSAISMNLLITLTTVSVDLSPGPRVPSQYTCLGLPTIPYTLQPISVAFPKSTKSNVTRSPNLDSFEVFHFRPYTGIAIRVTVSMCH